MRHSFHRETLARHLLHRGLYGENGQQASERLGKIDLMASGSLLVAAVMAQLYA